MDSEGIWNACTMNVITKMAITTVPMSDCRELIRSDPKLTVTLRAEGTAACGSERTRSGAGATPVEAITSCERSACGGGAGSVCDTVGWFTESMKSY